MSLVLDDLTNTTANLALAAIRIADALLSARRFSLVMHKTDQMDLISWAECQSGYLRALSEVSSAEAHLLRVVHLYQINGSL